MKNAYPIILDPADEGGYVVYVPDFDIYTQGDDMADAIRKMKARIYQNHHPWIL